MKKNLLLPLFVATALSVSAQNVEIEKGNFTTDYNSLNEWECPKWFKDAKFGIWAHWGPQCHAEYGDWYARFMYYDGTSQNNYHWDRWGDPLEFGLKDMCNEWKAENWNPQALVNLYKSVGARYFMALGNHHDNFDLWNSPYQEWNSVNVGPKKDIIKGWSDACKAAGLPLGVSIHASHAWTWLEPSQDYDGNLTKADGVGKWWEGLDPQELYAQNHAHSSGWENSGSIHSQWDWGNGASLPSEEYKTKFQNRVLELINDYNPDMIYFDDTAMPFYGCDEEIGKNILAHYYNHSAKKTGGTPNVVVTGKQLNKDQKKYMMWDVERGIPDRIQDEYWQTCTCIGDWHYSQNTYKNGGYKSAQQVVDMLVDIVSKNGNLLLSVPVKSDGTIDEKEEAILQSIKAWMDINGESIYGTRTWKTFGEGPLAESSNPLNSQGFNEGNNYSASDVRYVQKDGTLYATIMRWPAGSSFSFESLSMASQYYSGKAKSVELLGYGKVDYTETAEGLNVTLPTSRPNDIAPVFAITFEEGTENAPSMSEIIEAYYALADKYMGMAGYDTGKYNQASVEKFKEVINENKQYINADEATQNAVKTILANAFKTLKSEGRIAGGAPQAVGTAQDVTIKHLVEASSFSASEIGSRFGTPANWTVENFYVPVNTGQGVKNGIDAYSGFNTLSMGVWAGEDESPYTCDIANSRLYRKVKLEPGRYFFGTNFETLYNLAESACIYASSEPLSASEAPEKSIAYTSLKGASEGTIYGITFTIKEEQDVVLGYAVDLTTASQQEFRAKEVQLLYYGNMDFDALNDLIMSVDEKIGSITISSNTGYYKKEAADKLQAAMDRATEVLDGESSEEEFKNAYNALNEALRDFEENGKNIGGTPIGSDYEDITIKTFKEADNFARTPETDDGDRFGAPLNWVVENFGFGDQAGIDGLKGYDCLHLEVWWNSNSFPENGYDIKNVRLYQQAELPAGRYYFGASYPSDEANEDLYIFASNKLLNTDEIPTQSLAYEKVKLAPADGTFRGIYFTLEEASTVYLGWQTDFSNSVTNNLRASGVKLLYYGEMSYEKLSSLIESIETDMGQVKINNNTGYYSIEAYETLKVAIEEAKTIKSSADYDVINDAYNKLNDAYGTFLTKGKNAGGQPSVMFATDITEEKLIEASNFTRLDTSVSTRFSSPLYWTVENYNIPSSSEGLRGGLDKYPGYDCLTIGVWDDKGNAPEESDISNARVYRKIKLDAGDYYFGSIYNTRYNLIEAYVFASTEVLNTSDIPTQSIAHMKINDAQEDGKEWGISFTLAEPTEVLLGWQVDILNGNNAQEFRAKTVKLIKYVNPTDIEEIKISDATILREGTYNLQGMKVDSSFKGIVIKNGKKVLQ